MSQDAWSGGCECVFRAENVSHPYTSTRRESGHLFPGPNAGRLTISTRDNPLNLGLGKATGKAHSQHVGFPGGFRSHTGGD